MNTDFCASVLSEETTRAIARIWHSSRPKPRHSAMGLSPDESFHQRRRRELRELLSQDQSLRDKLIALQTT